MKQNVNQGFRLITRADQLPWKLSVTKKQWRWGAAYAIMALTENIFVALQLRGELWTEVS
jgi:hypothetical protein